MRAECLLASALALSGCIAGVGPLPGVDAGGSTNADAGSAPNEAGAAADGGGQPDDATASPDSGVTPFDANTPTVCSSGKTVPEVAANSLHGAGEPCIACHASAGGPLLGAAGTVYPTAHEPDLCAGVLMATVLLVDANGKQVSLLTNASGNFSYAGTLTLPYSATIKLSGQSLASTTPHTEGDCNGCHTEAGTQGAPGRLTY